MHLEPTTPEFDRYLRTDRYRYILEMSADGRIIGGEWLNGRATGPNGSFSEQPDFLWYPSASAKPAPQKVFTALETRRRTPPCQLLKRY